jgi:hypothetical protein
VSWSPDIWRSRSGQGLLIFIVSVVDEAFDLLALAISINDLDWSWWFARVGRQVRQVFDNGGGVAR